MARHKDDALRRLVAFNDASGLAADHGAPLSLIERKPSAPLRKAQALSCADFLKWDTFNADDRTIAICVDRKFGKGAERVWNGHRNRSDKARADKLTKWIRADDGRHVAHLRDLRRLFAAELASVSEKPDTMSDFSDNDSS